MFGSEILEVAIGIVFVFLLVSLICSAIREAIETKLKTRAAYLERGVRELLHDPEGRGLARRLYEHPLIFSLYCDRYVPKERRELSSILARGGSLPSYIPASNFALALMDMAVRGTDPLAGADHRSPVLTIESLRENVVNLENEPVQRVLLTAIDAAKGDLDRTRELIQTWFDSGMERVSGWYKRATQKIIFVAALGVVAALNVNTITIADHLYRNDEARAAIVARAEAAVADTAFLERGYAGARAALDSLALGSVRLPLGWSAGWGAPRPSLEPRPIEVWNDVFGPILGLLITAFAATLGAPFWFDLLNKMMVVRATVKPREKSPEEGSEDRSSRGAKRPPAADAVGAAGVPPAGTQPGAHHELAHKSAQRPIEDGCDVPVVRVTRDEDLPEAEGGVA